MKILKNCFGNNVPGRRFVFMADAPDYAAKSAEFDATLKKEVKEFGDNLSNMPDLKDAKDRMEEYVKSVYEKAKEPLTIRGLDSKGMLARAKYGEAIDKSQKEAMTAIGNHISDYKKAVEWAKGVAVSGRVVSVVQAEALSKQGKIDVTAEELRQLGDLEESTVNHTFGWSRKPKEEWKPFTKTFDFVTPDGVKHSFDVKVSINVVKERDQSVTHPSPAKVEYIINGERVSVDPSRPGANARTEIIRQAEEFRREAFLGKSNDSSARGGRRVEGAKKA